MTSLILGLLSALALPSTQACDVTPFKVGFKPGMGTHIAYYCKATEAEKKQALEDFKKNACAAESLKNMKRPVLVELAQDVRPYWFTKQDAERSGPILDLRLVLYEDKEGERVMRQWGLRALATGRKIVALPPPIPGNTTPPQPMIVAIDFEIGDPSIFDHDCPLSGCVDSFKELCPAPN